MKLIADLHTHTQLSGHAYCTIRENAQAAADRGLKILGTTEHTPILPGIADSFNLCNYQVVPRKLYGVSMLFGAEMNVTRDGSLSLPESILDRLDYALVGIHTACFENQGRERNTDLLISCIQHPKVKFISHPDDDTTPLNYERLISACLEYGVAPEVNNSSLIKEKRRVNCRENYRTMLQLCEEMRVPIIIDSDAHDPFYVGRLDRAIDLIAEYGFDENLVLNADEKRLLSFIGMRYNSAADFPELPDMGV